MSDYNNSIFWIDVDKIQPNPYQPRKEFNEDSLKSLAESIKQYGVLQPLVIIRKEESTPDGGINVTYELLAGERRLRASKLAGVTQVPAVIRDSDQGDKAKLEIAIVENIQREDLNPVDRARAFHQLVDEFNLKHNEIAEKVGKSREYVSNSIRILGLPQEMIEALEAKLITEGHARPILMLVDKPEEQDKLFREILERRITVREAEAISRRIAHERSRKKTPKDRETFEMEGRLAEQLGTRVHIEQKENGGKITIDFFTPEDLKNIYNLINGQTEGGVTDTLQNEDISKTNTPIEQENVDNKEEDEDLYSIRNFSL